jgi:hypothetical protein
MAQRKNIGKITLGYAQRLNMAIWFTQLMLSLVFLLN